MRKFRTRIFLQILIPMILVFALAIGGTIRFLDSSFREDAVAQKRVAMDNITRGLDDWLLSRVSEILQLSRIPLFNSGSSKEILAYMTDWRQTLSFLYDELYLIDAQGQWHSASGSSGLLEDATFMELFFKDRQLFTYAGPHKFYGEIFSDKFVIGAPIYESDGNLSHVLTATIALDTLHRIFGFFSFEDFQSWMVVNPDSMIIIHEDALYFGRSEKAAYGKIFLEDSTWGEHEAFVRVMRNGWKMVAFIPTDVLMAPIKKALNLMIALASVLVLLVTLMILGLSAEVSRPIAELTDGVHRIMSGDYSSRIENRSIDEIADLAESFNRLASRMTNLRTDDRFSFLGHVSARMAHELRKPLHVIQLAARAMEKPGADTKKLTGIIDEEIAAADKFVGEILSFSHDEKMDKQLFSLELLMSKVIEKYRLLAGEEDISITMDVFSPIPEIYVGVMSLEEVFGNLLQNAMDAIMESDPPPKERVIKIQMALNADKEIRIRIIDTGRGFDMKIADRLFDPYFTTREKGTGLGLSLSYRILMAHDARINLTNTAEGSGEVTLRFPT